MRPLHTRHVCYSFAPDPPGGTEVYVDALCRALPALGLHATVGTCSGVDGGFGVACDPESGDRIAAAVSGLLSEPSALATLRSRTQRQIATEWNYETAFTPVMTKLLHGASTAAAEQGAA